MQIGLGHLERQPAGRGRFQLMAFVHDQILVVRDDPVAGSDVRQQQGMIDDDHVCAFGGQSGFIVWAGAAGVLQTGLQAALFIVGGHPRPDGCLGGTTQVDLRHIACPAGVQPHEHLGEYPGLLRVARAEPARSREAPRAQVVAPALEDGRSIVASQSPIQIGKVLVDELILQVDGVSGHQHPLAIAGGPFDAGDQISHGLTRAGASLHQQVAALG